MSALTEPQRAVLGELRDGKARRFYDLLPDRWSGKGAVGRHFTVRKLSQLGLVTWTIPDGVRITERGLVALGAPTRKGEDHG